MNRCFYKLSVELEGKGQGYMRVLSRKIQIRLLIRDDISEEVIFKMNRCPPMRRSRVRRMWGGEEAGGKSWEGGESGKRWMAWQELQGKFSSTGS